MSILPRRTNPEPGTKVRRKELTEFIPQWQGVLTQTSCCGPVNNLYIHMWCICKQIVVRKVLQMKWLRPKDQIDQKHITLLWYCCILKHVCACVCVFSAEYVWIVRHDQREWQKWKLTKPISSSMCSSEPAFQEERESKLSGEKKAAIWWYAY